MYIDVHILISAMGAKKMEKNGEKWRKKEEK
jgi:hypothetical protein